MGLPYCFTGIDEGQPQCVSESEIWTTFVLLAPGKELSMEANIVSALLLWILVLEYLPKCWKSVIKQK